jgi:hypothetical protein
MKKSLTKADIMKTPFLFTQDHKNDYWGAAQEATKGLVTENILSRIFFSPDNYRLIQRMLRYAVYHASHKKYLIEDQNEQELTIVMRGIFLEFARHLPYKYKEQIMELNYRTVDDLVPNILTEIEAHEGYLNHIMKPREIIDRPVNASITGIKGLIPSVMTIYGN